MSTIKELVAKLGFDIDLASIKRFDSAINNAKTGMYEIGQRAQAVGRSLQGVGLGLTAGLTLPLVLAGRAAINAASDAEEATQKFNVVFRDIKSQADSVADNFGKNFGIAKDETRKLIGSTGDLLTGFGFTQQQALSLSEKVAVLGGDLASFQNVAGGTTEAVERLTKGILGETENLKLLGIVVRQDSPEFKAKMKTIMATTGATLVQAKAEAILQTALEQSKNALGDFARTSDSHANQMRILKARIQDVAVSFGNILLPAATKVAGVLLSVFNKMETLPEPVKKMIVIFGVIAASLGPILLILGTMIGSIGSAVSGFILLKGALAGAGLFAGVTLGGILILMAKIIAIALLVGAVLYVVFNDFTTWMNGGSSVFGALLGKFSDFKNMAVRIFGVIKDIFKSFWEALNTNSTESWGKFIDAIWRAFSGVGEVLGFIITKVVDFLTNFLGNAVVMLLTSIGKIISFVVSRALGLGSALAKAIYDGMKSTAIGKAIGGFISSLPEKQGGLYMGGMGGGYIVPPAQTLSSLNSTSNSQNVNVKNTIAVTVPPGTSEQQQAFLHEAAMKSFEASFSKKINDSLFAVPRGEQ